MVYVSVMPLLTGTEIMSQHGARHCHATAYSYRDYESAWRRQCHATAYSYRDYESAWRRQCHATGYSYRDHESAWCTSVSCHWLQLP